MSQVVKTTGRLFGVGLGPGDPELLTVKAVRIIETADVIAFFAKAGRLGNAHGIAERWIPEAAEQMPLYYPVTTEIPVSHPDYNRQLKQFYEGAAEEIAKKLAAGRDVAILSEGDPLLYGSFMHLYIRLKDRFPVTIVPGVSGMAGCWSAAGEAMAWGDDVLTVLPGTLPPEALAEKLARTDAAVIMKIGKNFAKIREVLRHSGHYDRALYVERGTMAGEKIMPLKDKPDDVAPYFAIILISGRGRRP
jgi:precorrin-2/cobalt-factor-2 C20-methyltransferase